jgi:hypothetical protein
MSIIEYFAYNGGLALCKELLGFHHFKKIHLLCNFIPNI